MKTIKTITLLLLLGGLVGVLSVMSADDATAQRSARRTGPERTRIIKELPQGYTMLEVNDREFFTFDSVFYRKVRDNYVVVRPPHGAVLEALPAGYTTLPVSENTYFRSKNVFYTETEGGYAVTAPPFGKSVEQLPDGYETLATRGDAKIYFHDGIVYRADPESDKFTIVNPRRRGRGDRGSAGVSKAGRRGHSQFGRFRAPNGRRQIERGIRPHFEPGRMCQGGMRPGGRF